MDIFGQKLSPRATILYDLLVDFVQNECIPAENQYESQLGTGTQRWTTQPAIMESLKHKAKSIGLWNLFLPQSYQEGSGLTNVEYACMAEVMGQCPTIAPEATNCAAPDSGNMELLAKFGNQFQKQQYLGPLLDGSIRSAFAMTERNVASSDALNIQTTIIRNDQDYVINGHKYYISGVGHPNFKLWIVMGKTTNLNKPKHQQHSIVLIPAHTPGIEVIRPCHVFGWDDANHGHFEVKFQNVRIPVENAMIFGEGNGFEVIQGRLGPGRLHHCCRALGLGERALRLGINRIKSRGSTFGQPLATHGVIRATIAESRIKLDCARLLVYRAASSLDRVGAKKCIKDLAIMKVAVPRFLCDVVDSMIQIHGAAGVSQDFPLAQFYAWLRTLRIADGPDEVHLQQIGRVEIIHDGRHSHSRL